MDSGALAATDVSHFGHSGNQEKGEKHVKFAIK